MRFLWFETPNINYVLSGKDRNLKIALDNIWNAHRHQARLFRLMEPYSKS